MFRKTCRALALLLSTSAVALLGAFLAPVVYSPAQAIYSTPLGQLFVNRAASVSALGGITAYGVPVMRDDVSALYKDTGASCTAADGGSQIQPATGHCWQIDWHSVGGVATPQLFGAKADGVTDDSAALGKAYAVRQRVRLAGSYFIGTSVTIPRGSLTDFTNGKLVTPASGVTVTIAGRITAPETQIFSNPSGGPGTVVGLRYNRPVWWGCNTAYNSGFDCAPSINAAVASAEASYNPGDPTHPSDGGRPTVDIGGGGFYGIASPINIHPSPSQQLDFKGSGILNAGSRIDVLSSFVGDNAIDVHGIASGFNGAWDLTLRDFQVTDYNRKSAGCIRFVPEGAGYSLNSGDMKPALIDNVQTLGCPIGYDFNNTLQLRIVRSSYTGIGNSNNTGISLETSGADAGAFTGSIVLDDVQMDPCPVHNAGVCTGTTNIKVRTSGVVVTPTTTAASTNTTILVSSNASIAAGQAVFGAGVPAGTVVSSINGNNITVNQNVNVASGATITFLVFSPAVAAVKIQSNSIMWAANAGLDALASNGAVIGDWWNGEGTQWDGYGCGYIKFQADGIATRINNIHTNHNYHTAVANQSCVPHTYAGTNGGQLLMIFDTNNQFVLGGAAQTTIFMTQVSNFSIAGNVTSGSGAANCAFNINNSTSGAITGNVANVAGGGTAWTYGVCIDAASSYITAGGNVANGTSVTGANGIGSAGGSHVGIYGNVGP